MYNRSCLLNSFNSGSNPTVAQMFKILEEKSANWDGIGRELGILLNYRQQLRKNIGLEDPDRLEAVLNKWVESTSPPVTWKMFKEKLKNMQYMDIVGKLEH